MYSALDHFDENGFADTEDSVVPSASKPGFLIINLVVMLVCHSIKSSFFLLNVVTYLSIQCLLDCSHSRLKRF